MMKIENKFKLAEKTLTLLKKIGKDEFPSTVFTLEAYQNGRETGYALINYSIKTPMVVFSEDRHSDFLVVYVGYMVDFAWNHIPTDKIYENKKLFRFDFLKDAAEYIINFFKENE